MSGHCGLGTERSASDGTWPCVWSGGAVPWIAARLRQDYIICTARVPHWCLASSHCAYLLVMPSCVCVSVCVLECAKNRAVKRLRFLIALRVIRVLTHIVKYKDSLPWAVQKWLNQSRCILGCWVGWVQGTCITWACRCLHGKGHFWGVCPLKSIVKYRILGVG